jgi:hypothetical protein
MYASNPPGSWQDFSKRLDNIGLPLMEVRSKYLKEQLLYEEFINTVLQQQTSIAVASGGSAPTIVNEILPSGCIEFVNNTSDGTQSRFWIVTSAPTNDTITWGDGETTTGPTTVGTGAGVGIGDGEDKLEIDYTYADSDTEYTVRIFFDNISLVTYLEFN